MKQVKLVGGTHNGEVRTLEWWQSILYLQHRISAEEMTALEIDSTTMWKPPEEVYEEVEDGVFEYKRTVHYKPEDKQ